MNNEQEWRQHALNLTLTFPYTVCSLPFLLCLPIYISTRLHVFACPGILYSLLLILPYFLYNILHLLLQFWVSCCSLNIIYCINGTRHYNFKLLLYEVIFVFLILSDLRLKLLLQHMGTLPSTIFRKVESFDIDFCSLHYSSLTHIIGLSLNFFLEFRFGLRKYYHKAKHFYMFSNLHFM